MKPEKMRNLADNMSAKIEEKLNSTVKPQNWTARRARMAESTRADGKFLEKVQYTLYGLADAIETGTLPDNLQGLKLGTKAVLETIMIYPTLPREGSNRDRILKAGITPETYSTIRSIVVSLSKPPNRSEEDEAIRIYNETRRLIGKIPGFFPTPPGIAKEIVDVADVDEITTILEPSCGTGSILEAIVRKTGTLENVTAIEINPTLAQHTRNVFGIEVIQTDFLEWTSDSGFDRVIMNPPFEHFQDIDHVTKAFDHLGPGGILVSIMSPSWTFSDRKKADEFRSFVDEHGTFYKLPDGAFKESGTGVRGVVVILTGGG